MFGPRFAFGFAGPEEEAWTSAQHHHRHFGPHGHEHAERGEGWTPPWMRRERPGPGSFWSMRRGRGPFGPRGPFGQEGPFGPGGRERFFGRGDMKYALLELVQERPMHGYEMIKALEARSGGFYSPSPGSIYPTLQMLEEGGYVTSNEVEGKKVYTITDAGRALLAERQGNEEKFAGPPWMRGHGHHRHLEMAALRTEATEVARLLAIAGRMSISATEKLAQLRAIIQQARTDLSALIYGEGSGQESTSGTTGQSGEPRVDQA